MGRPKKVKEQAILEKPKRSYVKRKNLGVDESFLNFYGVNKSTYEKDIKLLREKMAREIYRFLFDDPLEKNILLKIKPNIINICTTLEALYNSIELKVSYSELILNLELLKNSIDDEIKLQNSKIAHRREMHKFDGERGYAEMNIKLFELTLKQSFVDELLLKVKKNTIDAIDESCCTTYGVTEKLKEKLRSEACKKTAEQYLKYRTQITKEVYYSIKNRKYLENYGNN